MTLKDKVLLTIIKVLCTVVCVLAIAVGIRGIIQDGEGVNLYIIFFNLYILFKIWFKRVMIEDFIIITIVECSLALRYMLVNTLGPLDLIVVGICIMPIIAVSTCYFEEGYNVKYNHN